MRSAYKNTYRWKERERERIKHCDLQNFVSNVKMREKKNQKHKTGCEI